LEKKGEGISALGAGLLGLGDEKIKKGKTQVIIPWGGKRKKTKVPWKALHKIKQAQEPNKAGRRKKKEGGRSCKEGRLEMAKKVLRRPWPGARENAEKRGGRKNCAIVGNP